MKKLLCLSLVIALMLGAFSVAASAMPDRDSISAPQPASANDGSSFTQFFEGEWPNVLVGMRDVLGNVVIPPIYREIRSFANGFAVVAVGSQDYLQWGMINATGYVVIEPGYFEARDLFMIERLIALPDDVVVPTNIEALHWNYVRRIVQPRQYMEIFDIGTGVTYRVRSFAHGNHADVETVDAWNTELHLYTFGGVQTWGGRPVWVTFGGRSFAAAIHSMQHDVSTIQNNNMDGHVCLHFFGSTNNFSNRDMYGHVIAESIRISQLAGTAAWLRSLSEYTPSPPGYVPTPIYAPYYPIFGEPEAFFPAGPSPRVRIDGVFVNIPQGDQTSIIVDGRTLVPLRAVMEALGFEVHWDGKFNGAALFRHDDVITVIINEYNMRVNGTYISIDVAPRMINDRILVPVRAIAEATGFEVTWDDYNSIVDIRTN